MDDKKSNYDVFEPPKLPFVWLATCFIAPALVIILPEVFTSDTISWPVRLAVAFALLSVLLFVCCINFMLQSYKYAYIVQVLRLRLEHMKKNNDVETEHIRNKTTKVEERQESLERRIATIEAADEP